MNLCGALHAFAQRLPDDGIIPFAPKIMELLCKVPMNSLNDCVI